MYLRKLRCSDGYRYVIRESYMDADGVWSHRDLVDLGQDPGKQIEYVGGNGYILNPELDKRLQDLSVQYSSEDLEQIFFPFLAPHIQRVIRNFQGHVSLRRRGSRGGAEDAARQNRLHSFDKRRVHFLRCGRVQIGNLEGRTWKFFHVLVDKSRDEIEHVIEEMEKVLKPHEMQAYLYTSLRLEDYFPGHLLRDYPEGLNRERLDECFMDALCTLNMDGSFFFGSGQRHDATSLHPYLVKYAVYYFDSDRGRDPWWGRLGEDWFRGGFRATPTSRQTMAVEEACSVMGISREELGRLDADGLNRLYREHAKELHPDKGGDKESFIRMKEAFECLISCK